MSGRDTYYLTTPIYYVNDKPHIGHGYTTLACDVIARFMRLDGRRVRLLTGTDEHGQKVEKSAAAAGLDPQRFCDRVSESFRSLTPLLNISNDDFIRTTEDRHIRASQALWGALADSGNIYLDRYAGWYSVRDESFYGEDELSEGADGEKLSPFGSPVEWVEEPSYFFRLSRWQEPLLELYAARPDFILPEGRRNEVVSFVNGGLKDLSISRTSFSWGIPVPDDPEHVMYVWLDALTNYITAVGYPETDSESFRSFWPADVHVVGKDILRHHAVYWPAFLLAVGLEPPRRVFAHGWWTVEGQKMSKSVGNFIPPQELVDKYGLDAVRYFMMRELPFGNDGNLSHAAIVQRMNGDLANDLGNLAQRVLSMIARNCGGRLPQPGAFADEDRALLDQAHGLLQKVRAEMEVQALHQAIARIFEVVGAANRYVDTQAPWALRKTDPERMATVLYVAAETIRHLGILMQPVTPDGAERLLDQLALAADARAFASLGEEGALQPGTALPKPSGVFPRYSESEEAGALR